MFAQVVVPIRQGSALHATTFSSCYSGSFDFFASLLTSPYGYSSFTARASTDKLNKFLIDDGDGAALFEYSVKHHLQSRDVIGADGDGLGGLVKKLLLVRRRGGQRSQTVVAERP